MTGGDKEILTNMARVVGALCFVALMLIAASYAIA